MPFRLRYAILISKTILAGGCAASWLGLVSDVRAEPTAADKALAVTLFRDGKALMDENKLSEACPKLEESQRLDPGGGTLLNLALCHEKQGRTATAWAEFVEALGIARRDHRDQRIQFAEEHIAALQATLTSITLVVAPEADDPDLELRRDGSVISRAAWGTPIPVDPGDHTVEASAPNRKPWKSVVVVGGEGRPRAETVRIPTLERGEPVPAAPVAAAATAPSPVAPSYGAPANQPTDVQVTSGSSQRTWGYVALGVGVVGLGAGTVFGLTAMSKKSDSDDNCSSNLCSRRGVELNDDAGKFADLATIGFAVGIGGAVLGTVLLVTAPSSSERASAAKPSLAMVPVIGPGTAGIAGTGRF